jgi:hypothetical protein
MTTLLTPSPRRGGRLPDHSGIRLPVVKRRFVPSTPPPRVIAAPPSRLGGPPLRAA